MSGRWDDLELEGCVNARDLGGFDAAGGRRVRRGRVFRSDALHGLTQRDLRRLRDELGVRLIVDLRSTWEIELDGLGPLAAPPVSHRHMPLFDGDRPEEDDPVAIALADRYLGMLDQAAGPIARILEAFAASAEPAIFHCFAGKDRTGVIAAVLLGTLGVADEDIVTDYARTAQNLDAIFARLEGSRAYAGVLHQFPPETLHAERGTMERMLDEVRRRWGGMAGYTRSIGVSDDVLASLEARLLEE